MSLKDRSSSTLLHINRRPAGIVRRLIPIIILVIVSYAVSDLIKMIGNVQLQHENEEKDLSELVGTDHNYLEYLLSVIQFRYNPQFNIL